MPEDLAPYVFPAFFLGWLGFRFVRFARARARVPELLRAGAVIVDVRGPGEYASGAAPGSVNIPLGELAGRLRELDREKPVIVCCASGTRSAMAASVLRKAGFREVVNAGPWRNARVG